MSHPGENTAMMNYGEAGNRVNKRGDMSMAVDDEMATKTGAIGMDVQRMMFDPDKFRNFATSQIPTSRRLLKIHLTDFLHVSDIESTKSYSIIICILNLRYIKLNAHINELNE